jgi:hypothetical protein
MQAPTLALRARADRGLRAESGGHMPARAVECGNAEIMDLDLLVSRGR